jgi:cation:H+ antiporter
MEILLASLLVVGGLALLTGGGEALVRGATAIAQLVGLPAAVIGLTVVAMGTSLPELVVSLTAGLQGQPDIAVANVVGSNIFNVAAALGLTALLLPLPVHGNAVKLEWPFMFLASCLCLVLARDGLLDRPEGAFFVVAMVLFVAYTVRLARREVRAVERAELEEAVDARTLPRRSRRYAVAGGLVLAGVALLVVGGRLLVDGAVALARLAGLTERVIGLTVVAAGTGAPELATSVVAALRKRPDVAVANMIGSNIFNILGILGLSALLRPLTVSPAIVDSDLWWMLGTTLLLYPLMRSGGRLARAEGGLLAAAYVVYVGMLLS